MKGVKDTMTVRQVEAFVCDLDDRLAQRSITFSTTQGRVQLDLCGEHYALFQEKGHFPRRGRIPKVALNHDGSSNGNGRKKAAKKAPVEADTTA